jgi:hypothetical protein
MTGVAPPDLREEPTTPAPGAQDSPVVGLAAQPMHVTHGLSLQISCIQLLSLQGGISGPQTETRQVERDGRKFTVVSAATWC